jgi:hypothetical protein
VSSRDHIAWAALICLELLHYQSLSYSLQLLPDPHLAAFQVNVVPLQPGRFPEAQSTRQSDAE